MRLFRAVDSEIPAIADLVNSAYRGDSSRKGWTTEADYLSGPRIDAETLRRDLKANPKAALMTLREAKGRPLLGCVWLEPAEEGVWYLGMLTVRPVMQKRQLGRKMLEAAEIFVTELGATRMRMTVIQIREPLIAWYLRRGYVLTGETRPFPYEGNRFGEPLRDDLHFVVLEKPVSRVSPAGARSARV